MADPINTLNARLAAGEISEEEYDKLYQKLTANAAKQKPADTTPPPAYVQPAAQTESGASRLAGTISDGLNVVFGIIGIIVIGAVLFSIFSKDKPKIGSLKSSGGRVEFKIVNDTKYSEDLVLWIVQNNIKMCPHKARVKKGYTHTIKFYCGQLRDGKFKGRANWASSEKTLAAVAKRIK